MSSILSFVQQTFSSFKPLKTERIVGFHFLMHYKVGFCSLLLTAAIVIGFGEAQNLTCRGNFYEPKELQAICEAQGIYREKDIPDTKNSIVNTQGRKYWQAPTLTNVPDPERIYYRFDITRYQKYSVAFLIVQALFLTVPYYIWRFLESSKLKNLLKRVFELQHPDNEEQKSRQNYFLNEMAKSLKEEYQNQNYYFYCYFCCEMLNLLVVAGNFFINNWLLNGHFLLFGLTYVNSRITNIRNIYELIMGYFVRYGIVVEYVNDVNEVIPTTVYCYFDHYGPSGTLIIESAVCSVSGSRDNEILFSVTWTILLLLALLSFLNLGYYTLVFTNFCVIRPLLLKNKITEWKLVYKLCRKGGIGDFQMLMQIKRNISTTLFRSFLRKLDSLFD